MLSIIHFIHDESSERKKILPTEIPNLWDEFCTKDFRWIFTLSPNIFPDKWYQPRISVNCLLTQIKQKYASRRGRLPVVLVCQCLYSIDLSWSDNWRIITSYIIQLSIRFQESALLKTVKWKTHINCQSWG